LSGDHESLTEIVDNLRRDPTNETAWSNLYLRLWPFMIAVAYRLLNGDRSAAEDVAQKAFLKVMRSRGLLGLEDEQAIRAFVGRATHNCAIDHWRRNRRIEFRGTSLDVEPASAIDPRDESALETADWLANLLSELSEMDRRILQMTIDGEGLSAIAEATGWTYSNVGVRLHRLRQKLRKELKIENRARKRKTDEL
jgi:RNA polymerase sigma-70 factor, ECF subfamily